MKNHKILAKGAEAIIFLEKNKIIKDRIPKSYRIKEIDEKIRKSRTKKEIKLLDKASKLINVPKITKPDKFTITMEYIEGDKLSDKLNSYTKKKQKDVMKKLGKSVAKLHENDIIHGDLTTSNALFKRNEIYIIDFGLGFISKRMEDRAVDIHLIKQALEAKHWQNYIKLFKHFLKGYKSYKESKKILEQLELVEKRGRYRH